MNTIANAADLLMNARLSRQTLVALPERCLPTNLTEAYAVQAALTDRILANDGGYQVGYKIACTNKAAQQFLSLDAPFYGPLLSSLVYVNPTRLRAADFFMRVIEPEFAFEMAHDLPPTAVPYTPETVAGAVGAAFPSIEIVDSRFDDWTTVGGFSLIADSATHGAWVKGEGKTGWQGFDLAAHQVKLIVNGELNQTGRGQVVLGHPLNALTWLANALRERGHRLKAGDLITTGVCVDKVYAAAAGDEIRADFGLLGLVEVTFAPPNL